MTIYRTHKSSFVMHLDADDIEKFHVDPNSVSAEQVVSLLRINCNDFSVDVFTKAQIELFPGNNELMLFIRTNIARPIMYIFDNIEMLLTAIQDVSADTPSSLYHYNDRYLLAVWPFDTSFIMIDEFCTDSISSPDYFLHIIEHGKTLVSENAIQTMKNTFSRTK